MTSIRTIVRECRPLDSQYDMTYIGPHSSYKTKNMVLHKEASLKAISSPNMVAGQEQFKYFRRPIMPKITPLLPNILLAPKTQNPLVPNIDLNEPEHKSVEVQTMYRESEAQTIPYTPSYFIPEGENPEILLLKDLSYGNGLPLGKKEFEMVLQARFKRVLESNVPPFTDEASLLMRKKLLEKQELKELKFRESEIDAKREERLGQLRQALLLRDENSMFLSAQRIERIRQHKINEREQILSTIQAKRIKVLRRLANERNKMDPILHESTNTKSIIEDHFDKSSNIYAAKKFLGYEHKVYTGKFDVQLRTKNIYNDIYSINALEECIPPLLIQADENKMFGTLRGRDKDLNYSSHNDDEPVDPKASLGYLKAASSILLNNPKSHLLDDRLTSATRRNIKNTKKEVEEMNIIIQRKKKMSLLSHNAMNMSTGQLTNGNTMNSPDKPLEPPGSAPQTAHSNILKLALLSRRVKGRPVTPDLAVDEKGESIYNNNSWSNALYREKIQAAAIVYLQSIIRGRSVQNVMVQGRYRRKELIAELRQADEHHNAIVLDQGASVKSNEPISRPAGFVEIAEKARDKEQVAETNMMAKDIKLERDMRMRSTTEDAIIGGVTSNLAFKLASEMTRNQTLHAMQIAANEAIEERRKREAAESGRRQRYRMAYPPEPTQEPSDSKE